MSTFPTVDVTVNCIDAAGVPLADVLCLFRLNQAATVEGVVIPTNLSARTDSAGVAVLALCPNAVCGGSYSVRLSANGYDVRGLAVIPNHDCLLDEVFQPMESQDYFARAMQEIATAVAEAEEAAETAGASADTATTAAADATAKAAESEQHAETSQAQAAAAAETAEELAAILGQYDQMLFSGTTDPVAGDYPVGAIYIKYTAS